jgi:ubiquinone biosynthesis protein
MSDPRDIRPADDLSTAREIEADELPEAERHLVEDEVTSAQAAGRAAVAQDEAQATGAPPPQRPEGRRVLTVFLLRYGLTFLALLASFALLPWLRITGVDPGVLPILGDVAIAAAILLLLRTVLRPILGFLTARLFFWSFGVIAIVIDGLIIVLTGLLTPGYWEITWSPPLLWAIVTILLLTGLLYIIDGVFGFGTPFVEDAQSSRWYWSVLGRLSLGGRNALVDNLRLVQTLNITGRYLTQVTMDRTPFAPLRSRMQKWLYPDREVLTTENLPRTFRMLLQDLGPTYVKIGQMLSSRAEALPPEWAEELEKLQNTVAPYPYREVVRIVTDELGGPPETLFAEFDPVPLAAASTAQVHRARLFDGTDVVVKVQRPDIDVTVRADLNIMKDVIHSLERGREAIARLGLSSFLGEFADNVVRELDYRNEAYNMRRVTANMARYPQIHIPTVYEDRSTRRVLTMELIRGVKLSDAAAIDASDIDRDELADVLTRAIVKQVMFDGFFHGDPHPGNIWAEPATGRIVLLDLGMVGELNQELRMALADLVYSIREVDSDALASVLLSMSVRSRPVDEKAFREEVDRTVQRYMVYGTDTSLQAVISAVLATMYDRGLRLNQQLTIALKALFQIEEAIGTLSPRIALLDVAQAEAVELLREQINVDNVTAILKQQASKTVRELARRAPSLSDATLKWMDQYQSGRLSVHIDTSDLSKDLADMRTDVGTIAERFFIAIILAGLLIASAVVTQIPTTVEVLGVTLADLAGIVFVLGSLAGLYFVFAYVWRAFRRSLS